MIGKELKNLRSVGTKLAQSAPKFAPKLPALSRIASKLASKPAPKPTPTPKPPALGSARSVLAGTMKKGGKVSSASKRADNVAQRGKTKGKMV